jgi:peptidoglycan/xylan/chitin deacetylase (PgdA/CDA1 family)
VVALTFDDGPNDLATPVILDVLDERGTVATFFVFGNRATTHLIAGILEAGHAVQPHWSAAFRPSSPLLPRVDAPEAGPCACTPE